MKDNVYRVVKKCINSVIQYVVQEYSSKDGWVDKQYFDSDYQAINYKNKLYMDTTGLIID